MNYYPPPASTPEYWLTQAHLHLTPEWVQKKEPSFLGVEIADRLLGTDQEGEGGGGIYSVGSGWNVHDERWIST